MEWLDGEDLRGRLGRGVLSARETVVLGHKIAGALAALHSRRLVHRDVKPGNVFLTGGRLEGAKLVDFGLVRREVRELEIDVTATGIVVGTPSYMAPEQARGTRSIDARADIFALGCLLYRCLSGKAPFEGRHIVAVLTKVLLEQPTRLHEIRSDVPAALAMLLGSMLEKDPDRRPASAAEVARALEAIEPMLEARA